MKGLKIIPGLLVALVAGAAQAKELPTQVVYRFDDHRYLELKGFNCEGELWYTDTQRGIHTEPVNQFYRMFTRKFVHPSERYIAIMSFDSTGFIVSKDYGQSWQSVGFSPGPNEPDGMDRGSREDVISFTVVNDQGFLLTKNSLYMSSKPFDDPRIRPGGPGISFITEDGANHILKPTTPGPAWGKSYMTKRGLEHDIGQYRAEWQDLPDKVPEVKDYKGWDHMRCDMDAGK